jgi:predicted P-loop ATPase
MAMYSTHSHTPDDPRLRFIIPLDRPVSPDEYGAIARKLALDIGIETLDKTTYEPARLMYWPSCPNDGVYLFRHQAGPVVCADKVLAEYGPDEAWRDTTLWPCASDEAEVVRQELKELGDPREKPGLVGAFCRTYDVEEAIAEFLGDVYEPCDAHSREPRYTYAGGSTYGGASVYNDGLYLFSRHDTDPAGGGIHCQNAFDLVRIHQFGHLDKGNLSPDHTKRASYKAMCDWVQGLEPVKLLLAQERMDSVKQDFADMGDESVVGGSAEAVEQEGGEEEAPNQPQANEWMKKLTYKPKTSDLDATAANVLLILRNDPMVKGAIGYNELLEREVIVRGLPWHPRVRNKRDGDPWVDSDSANLRVYMEQVWGLKNRADIQDAFAVVQEENRFNPLKDYLSGLRWDGVYRLDDLLIRYLHAPDNDYVRAVTRKWFTAAVARVFEPGRKFDQMLVLCGPQGLGKSTLCQVMSRGRFSDSITDLRGKSAYEQLQGSWLVEFAELASMKRAEVEVIKNFVSKTEDSYRPAYGQFIRTYKRQCVFFGTTNDIEFLKDRTGNRRFWPVEVSGPETVPEQGVLVGLEDEVDQLWAEAVMRYREGEALWLNDGALQQFARTEQERYTVQDELVGQITEYLDTRLPDNWETLTPEDRTAFIQGHSPLELGSCNLRRDAVSIIEIRCELCGEDRSKGGGNDFLSRRIANLMNTMPGWTKMPKRKRVGMYGPQWVYRRDVPLNCPAEYAPNYVHDPREKE